MQSKHKRLNLLSSLNHYKFAIRIKVEHGLHKSFTKGTAIRAWNINRKSFSKNFISSYGIKFHFLFHTSMLAFLSFDGNHSSLVPMVLQDKEKGRFLPRPKFIHSSCQNVRKCIRWPLFGSRTMSDLTGVRLPIRCHLFSRWRSQDLHAPSKRSDQFRTVPS